MPSKKYTVFWTNTAKNDLVDIIEYISSDSIDNAYKIYTKAISASSFAGKTTSS